MTPLCESVTPFPAIHGSPDLEWPVHPLASSPFTA
jgi:hypothetical protein